MQTLWLCSYATSASVLVLRISYMYMYKESECAWLQQEVKAHLYSYNECGCSNTGSKGSKQGEGREGRGSIAAIMSSSRRVKHTLP